MVHYKPLKITIYTFGLAKIIIDVVVHHHGFSDSIITNQSSLFMSKFWSSLCYLLGIKCHLSTAFHLQTDSHTKRQTVLWKPTFKPLSISSRKIGSGSYWWPSLLIIIPKTRVAAIRFLSKIVAIIFTSLLRKTLILAPNLKLLTSDQQSNENW